jgi:hypothetical protein
MTVGENQMTVGENQMPVGENINDCGLNSAPRRATDWPNRPFKIKTITANKRRRLITIVTHR